MAERKIDPKFNIHENYSRMNIVNPYRHATGGGGSSHEPETTALMASIGWADDSTPSPHNGLTYSQVYNKLDAYFASGKTNGWLGLLKAVYLFIGDNADNHKWNAVDPQDTNAAHRMIWNGALTHNEFGVKGEGGYGNTNFIESQHSQLDNESYGFYSRTNIAASYIDMGTVDGTVNSRINGFWVNNSTYWRIQSSNYFETQSQINSLGFYAADASSLKASYQRNGQVENLPVNRIGLSNHPFYLLASNSSGTPSSISMRNYSYAFIGESLTTEQMTAHYSAVQQLQTDLGRNV